MSDAEIISKLGSIVRSKKVLWIEGDYVRDGEMVHWECFIKLLGDTAAVGFDEYLEKYEDAVDLYDMYVRSKLPDIESALRFVLDSFPLAAEKMRRT
ncbi:hypothetical protein [Variovorax sp. R-27]|uniref:hypothetical protein n=1 Tax=Variovorax sp. R-27 TaxID=3404058 RepID=UPI003CEDFA3F